MTRNYQQAKQILVETLKVKLHYEHIIETTLNTKDLVKPMTHIIKQCRENK